MADLSDIFDDDPEPTTTTVAPVGTAPGVDQDIAAKAQAAVVAYTNAQVARARYKSERETLERQIDLQTEALRKAAGDAELAYAEAREVLLASMDAKDVKEIPMLDRDPIMIKTTPGRRKPITKKWLTSEFGDQQAKTIWGKVPKTPETRTLVIPNSYEDEPGD